MSELADIAAAAGIAIVDSTPTDSGDMILLNDTRPSTNVAPSHLPDGSGDTLMMQEVLDFEAEFAHRYTDDDPDYAKTVAESMDRLRPPCIDGYFGKRQRDNNRSWQRGRGGYGDRYHDGGRGGHRGRGDYHNQGNWNQRQNYDNRGRDYYDHRDRNAYNYDRRDRSADNYDRRDRDRNYHYQDRYPR